MASNSGKTTSGWPNRIRKVLVKNSGRSIDDLAFAIGATKESLLDWLMGKSNPSATNAERIASLERRKQDPQTEHFDNSPWYHRLVTTQKVKVMELPTEGPLGYGRYLDLIDEYSRARLCGVDGQSQGNLTLRELHFAKSGKVPEGESPRDRKEKLASVTERFNEAHRRYSDEIRSFPVSVVADREGWSPEEVRIAVHLMKADIPAFEGAGSAHGRLLVRIAGGPSGDPLTLRRLLAPEGKLRKSGFIERVMQTGCYLAFGSSSSPSVLEGSYALSKRGRQELLGPLLDRCVYEDRNSSVSRVTTPRYNLDAVVLPAAQRAGIGNFIAELRHRKLLYETWGLSKVVHYGRGLVLLFAGPPGTGKSMLAEALAGDERLKFMAASLQEIESKWVGETEKNISALFREAREAGALLFIDEADGLFASRTLAQRSWEVRNVNVLLKEVEEFEGVCVLATNNAAILDGALESRLSLYLEFTMPDVDARLAIWKKHLPHQMPLEPDVDLRGLAQSYEISGRDIKQAVLGAARAAVARAGASAIVTMADLELATAGRLREAKKIGFVKAASVRGD